MAKLYGYIRTATTSQAAVDDQRRTMDEWVRRNGCPIEQVFQDVCSGHKGIPDRTGWTAMEDVLKEGDVILVVGYDRIHRNPARLARILALLEESKIKVELAYQDF